MSSDFTAGPLLSFDIGGGDTPPERPYIAPNLPTRKLLKPVPEEPDCYFLTIDNSTMEYFLKCSRAAEYYAVRSREPDRSAAALNFGGALHKAIEVLMRYGVSDATMTKGIGLIYEQFETRPVAVDEWRTADHAVKVFKKYCEKYPLELFKVATDSSARPHVEIPFAIPLGAIELNADIRYHIDQIIVPDVVERLPDWWETRTRPQSGGLGFHVKKVYILWSGRMDAILTWDGQYWIMDHKTSSVGGDGFFNDFILSQQTTGYTWAASRIIGAKVEGLLLNALICRKPTPTGKTIEFVRRRYHYTEDHLAEWEEDIMALVSDFLTSLKRGYFPKQTTHCEGKYGQCKYHSVCTLPRPQRPVMLQSSLFRNVTWSPLHVEDTAT